MSRTSFLATSLILGLTLAGCGGNVQIGAVVSETGIADEYGRWVRQGLDLALDEVNEAGGINGRVVELVYRDDRSDPETGKQVVQELIDEVGVDTIIGAVTSPVTVAIAPICEKSRTVLLSPSATAPEITEAGNFVFRNCPSDILEGTSMADFARDLGLSRIVIFAVDNAWGNGLVEVFTQKYENKFRQVQQVFRFEEGGGELLNSLVEEALALEPEGIYIVAYLDSAAKILGRLAATEADAVIMATGALSDDIIRVAGADAERLVYPQPSRFNVESSAPVASAFVTSFRTKYGEDPTIWSAYGYDALKMVARAMGEVGSDLGVEVRAGLASIKTYEGASGSGGFDSNGDVVQYPRLFIVHQGAAVPYERFLEDGHSLSRPEVD